MLDQRYDMVKAYQKEMLDEAANQRLASLGRAHRTADHGFLAAIRHALTRLSAAEMERSRETRPRMAHPAH